VLADTTGFLISMAHFMARDRAHEAFRELPIEARHYGVLVTLDELGPTSQQALTNAMRVSATMVTQIVDDLERLGLAERRRNPRRPPLLDGQHDRRRRPRARGARARAEPIAVSATRSCGLCSASSSGSKPGSTDDPS